MKNITQPDEASQCRFSVVTVSITALPPALPASPEDALKLISPTGQPSLDTFHFIHAALERRDNTATIQYTLAELAGPEGFGQAGLPCWLLKHQIRTRLRKNLERLEKLHSLPPGGLVKIKTLLHRPAETPEMETYQKGLGTLSGVPSRPGS